MLFPGMVMYKALEVRLVDRWCGTRSDEPHTMTGVGELAGSQAHEQVTIIHIAGEYAGL